MSFPKPHHEPKIEEMEIFELMAIVIKRGEAARFARLYGCSEETVRKWRNDPVGDGDLADPQGRRSPAENLLQFMDVLNAIDPARVPTVWSRLEYEIAKMLSAHGNDTLMRRWESLEKANKLAREIVAATQTYPEKDDG